MQRLDFKFELEKVSTSLDQKQSYTTNFAIFVNEKIKEICLLAQQDGSENYAGDLLGVDHIFKAVCPLEGIKVTVEFVYNKLYRQRQEIQNIAYNVLLFSAKISQKIPTPNTGDKSAALVQFLTPWNQAILPGEGYFTLNNSKNATDLQSPVLIARATIPYDSKKQPHTDILEVAIRAFASSAQAAKMAFEEFLASKNTPEVVTKTPYKNTSCTTKRENTFLINNFSQLAKFILSSPPIATGGKEPFKHKYTRLFFAIQSIAPGMWWLRNPMIKQDSDTDVNSIKIIFNGIPFLGVPFSMIYWGYRSLPWMKENEKNLNPSGNIVYDVDPLTIGKCSASSFPHDPPGSYGGIAQTKVPVIDQETLKQNITEFYNSAIKLL